MDIKKNITVLNQWKGRFGQSVKGVVLHSTAGTYKGSIAWFKNPSSKVSCHYIIDVTGEISMCVEENNTAWHAGNITVTKEQAPRLIQEMWGTNPNIITVGIELTDNANPHHIYPQVQYQAAVELVADICTRYKLTPDRGIVILHREIDPAHRSDPVGQWDHDRFIKDVQSFMTGGGVSTKNTALSVADEVTVVVPIKSFLYVRSAPNTKAKLSGSQKLYNSDIVKVKGVVLGESISGNSNWYVSMFDNYFWAGGTNRPNPQLSSVVKGINMTQEENDKKKAEFEARKATLESRKAELEAAVVANNSDFQTYQSEWEAFANEPVVAVEAPVETISEVAVDEPVVLDVPADASAPVVTEEDKSLVKRLEDELNAIKAKLGL